MGERISAFALFPLGIVMLPSELVPLHIFEDRYKLMVSDAMESDSKFGIVWMSDRGLADVGCIAEITQILSTEEDGRMNILTQGRQAFRLLERFGERPYPAGEIELLDDVVEPEPDGALLAAAHESYARLVEKVTDKRPDESELAKLDAYGMAAAIEFDPAPKQELLEERSETERLRMVTDLLERTIGKLDASDTTAEIAKTNGKLR